MMSREILQISLSPRSGILPKRLTVLIDRSICFQFRNTRFYRQIWRYTMFEKEITIMGL